ncbi:glycosyltransferase family 2 protein [Candidatus Uhrbacteria bacterium]|nr:glycosyltransferase family 2 protein [Candidatus Uhrbacteria bacterium]
MKVVAVIPAYNEEKRIKHTIVGVLRYTPHVVVVDDGSQDQTHREARAAGAQVVRHAVNRGQGAALKTGTMVALSQDADVVVHLDADGQHDPQSLPDVLMPIETDEADVVFGSRYLGMKPEGMPWTRRWVHRAGRLFNRYLLGVPHEITDAQSGLRAMRAEAAHAIDFMNDGMAHCSEILRLVTRSDLRWAEVPVCVRYTEETLAKGQKASNAFKIVWQLFLRSFR